jgi:hypothetical protein
MMTWLPLVAFAAGALDPPREIEVVASPKAAQVRLAEALSEADAIETVEVSRGGRDKAATVTFSIVRGGELLRVAATTSRGGEIASLSIEPVGPAAAELHGLTWLAAEVADATAIVRLTPADRGGVLLSTNDGRRYLVGPPRGPRTGNEAVEARWGAAWSNGG